MRAWAISLVAAILSLTLACTDGRREAERRAEVARKVAEAEGAPPGDPEPRSTGAPPAIAREADSPSPPVPEPPTPAQSAWASAIARAIDNLDRHSRQLLSVTILRAAKDPRQKSQDRARGFYEKASSLADGLPAPAVDHFTVDGQPQRQELRLGLQYSDPANRDGDQVRAVAAICGAIAERDRHLWDELFGRHASGEVTAAALPSTGEERLALGALRRKMILDVEERIAALERLHAGAARDLRGRLVAAANDLCGEGDAVSCAAASFL